MPRIKVLPRDVAEKIAAGEVVERPASVLRELIENSIDAGADDLRIQIKSGGRALIRVSDNGSGMDASDARLCTLRNATSKIEDADGLFDIKTMGFRGEAMPSIAAVSRMTIRTAERGSPEGMEIEIHGGEAVSEKAAPATGTTVEVRDLFYNTPARRKFLKRDSTELMHMVDALTKLALSHPGLAITLDVDGEENMRLPRASGLRERLTQVYGAEFLEGLAEVTQEAGPLALRAFVSDTSALRESRANQMVFINRRPVRDPSLSHAVYAAFEGYAPREKHPVYFLYIEMDPRLVDFNVHPAKREVRFADKGSVYRFVRRAISGAVRVASPPIPEGFDPTAPLDAMPRASGVHPPGMAQEHPPAFSGPAAGRAPEAYGAGVSEALPMGYDSANPVLHLGESFVATLAEGGGVSIIDHHAAHERVLYERLLRGMDLGVTMLLFPRQVRLSRKEHMAVTGNPEILREFGIEAEDFGQDSVIVRSLPMALEEADMRGILSDAAAALIEGDRPGVTLRQNLAARIACHGSVRGSRRLGPEEVRALMADLMRCEDPWHCPHGRPTLVTYALRDLRKLFKRG